MLNNDARLERLKNAFFACMEKRGQQVLCIPQELPNHDCLYREAFMNQLHADYLLLTIIELLGFDMKQERGKVFEADEGYRETA